MPGATHALDSQRGTHVDDELIALIPSREYEGDTPANARIGKSLSLVDEHDRQP